MKKYIVSSLVLALVSAQAWAIVDVRSNTSMSYGKATGDFISSKPTLLNYTEDLSVLYSAIPVIQLGIGGSYRFVRQTSTVYSEVGNYRGTRWEVYPILGLKLGRIWTGFAPVWLFGRYNMAKQTVGKLDVYYREPLGGKVFLSYDMSSLLPLSIINWGISLTGDYMTFKKYTLVNSAGVATDKDMDSRLRLWSVGMALNFNFGV